MSDSGELIVSEEPATLQLIGAPGEALHQCTPEVPNAPIPSYSLSPAERQALVEEGCMRLHGIIPPALVDEALRHINMTLLNPAAPGGWVPDDDGKLSPAPHVRGHPAIRALLYSSALYNVLEQLLGEGQVTRPQMGQLALRFPNNKADMGDDDWHIDGQPTWHKSPFQLLVGVALSSQPTDNCGNLAVFAGCHGVLHEAVERVRLAHSPAATDGSRTPWHGMKPRLRHGSERQIHLEPGDVIIAHQKVPHRVSPNRSPHVRYMVYFRVSSVRHKPMASLSHGLWAHFDGLHEVAETGRAEGGVGAAVQRPEPEQHEMSVD